VHGSLHLSGRAWHAAETLLQACSTNLCKDGSIMPHDSSRYLTGVSEFAIGSLALDYLAAPP